MAKGHNPFQNKMKHRSFYFSMTKQTLLTGRDHGCVDTKMSTNSHRSRGQEMIGILSKSTSVNHIKL